MFLGATPLVTSSNCPRHTANFHPSVWGDHFIGYASESLETTHEMEEQIEILKEEVRKMLVLPTKKPLEKMFLIDSIQRLGVNYHFETEIDDILQQIHGSCVENGGKITLEEDLPTLALLFRLLRQHGYRISSDVFGKFKDEQGIIKEGITSDIEGMISLYEASHLRIHGESILDEVLASTTAHIESMINQLNSSLAAKVKHSLRHPLRKNHPRLQAWHYISSYQENPCHDETLLALAKLNFNLLQKLHQKEVGIISLWWKELNFTTKLPFVRDRMVELYFWILGVYFEPGYSLARRIMTKIICITSAIDDIYDAYGTFEELQLFTTAIERWDTSCVNFLPEYMRFCYKALLDVYEDIKNEMAKEGRAFCANYFKDEMKRQVQSYFVEAKWYNSGYIPTTEEYMANSLISCGYRLLIASSFIGMGPIATEEVFQWLTTDPQVVKASEIINRLMDDIVSNEFEQERGHVVSAIECYTKQYGVNKEDAIFEFRRQVENAWKDINEAFLEPTQVPKPFLMRILNYCRVMDVLYKDADCYTHSAGSTKDIITALLLNQLSL